MHLLGSLSKIKYRLKLSNQVNQDQTYFSFYSESKQNLLYLEDLARAAGHKVIAGVSEEGRDSLAGPVVVASCVLPKGLIFSDLKENKKQTPSVLRSLYHQIISHQDISYRIEIIEPTFLEPARIFELIYLCMKQATSSLSKVPNFTLVDGPYNPFPPKVSRAVLRGPSVSCTLAAAYILAKVTRDAIMEGHDIEWPEYGFAQNKGYLTTDHLRNLARLGPSPIHRKG